MMSARIFKMPTVSEDDEAYLITIFLHLFAPGDVLIAPNYRYAGHSNTTLTSLALDLLSAIDQPPMQ
jgi:hypothetical protein